MLRPRSKEGAMANAAIPEAPEQLTDQWLTDALRGGGVLDTVSVSGHTSELVEMQGATATVARVTLDYDATEDGAPRSLVAKFATPHAPIRELMHGLGGYLREVEFYRQLGADPGVPTPRCFHADIDPGSGAFVLLLEDMVDCRVGDGLFSPVEDVELAVRHLAPFHARWWDSAQLRDLSWLDYPGTSGFDAFLQQVRGALAGALSRAREIFGDEFPPSLAVLTERLVANYERLAAEAAAGPLALVHGDFHPGQIFFPTDGGGRFAVFDWQTVRIGRGGDDLARIVTMGMPPQERRSSDKRLIALYHSLLLEHGVADYDLDQCWLDFRRGLLGSVLVNVIAGAAIDLTLFEEREAETGVSVGEVLFGWLDAALTDHDVLELLPPA
jgi:hypothetical protein